MSNCLTMVDVSIKRLGSCINSGAVGEYGNEKVQKTRSRAEQVSTPSPALATVAEAAEGDMCPESSIKNKRV